MLRAGTERIGSRRALFTVWVERNGRALIHRCMEEKGKRASQLQYRRHVACYQGNQQMYDVHNLPLDRKYELTISLLK